jgi:hypothetical protein
MEINLEGATGQDFLHQRTHTAFGGGALGRLLLGLSLCISLLLENGMEKL